MGLIRTLSLPIAGLICLLAAIHSIAGEAKAPPTTSPATAFRAVFGEREQAVSVSRDPLAPAKFAVDLVAYAREIDDLPLRVVILRRAYDFGIKNPAGYQAAIESIRLLREMQLGMDPDSREKLLAVYRLRLQKANNADRAADAADLVDELMECEKADEAAGKPSEALVWSREAVKAAASGHLDNANDMRLDMMRVEGTAKELDQLAAEYDKTPNPANASRLATFLILDVHRPTDAVRYAGLAADRQLQTIADLTSRQLDRLTETENLEVAKWGEAAAADKTVPAFLLSGRLRFALGYYERYLALHKTNDAQRLAVQVAYDSLIKLDPAHTRAAILRTALVYLSFDPPTISAKKDIVVMKNLGQLGGVATVHGGQPCTGIYSSGWSFGGNGEFVDLPVALKSEIKDKTITAWVRLTDVDQAGPGIVSVTIGQEFDAIVYNEKPKGWFFGSDSYRRSATTNVKESKSEWVHIAAVYAGNKATMYRNGSAIGSVDLAPPLTLNHMITVSVAVRDGRSFLHGALDDIAMFGRALSPEEIRQIMGPVRQDRP